MLTLENIWDQLRSLGLNQGDAVIVHTAYKSIGPVDGGILTLLEALVCAIGSDGGLMLPNLNIPHKFTAEDPPCFDIRNDGIGHMVGAVPEVFKRSMAEYFSIHSTHALMGTGARAKELLQEHELAGVPCGAGTPWDKNGRAGGKILLIGVDQKRNTSYHTAEELLPNSYKLTPEIINGTCIVDGKQVTVPSRLHQWSHSADFNIINDELQTKGILTRGQLGKASCMLLQAGPFIKLALEKMEQDPYYFIQEKKRQ